MKIPIAMKKLIYWIGIIFMVWIVGLGVIEAARLLISLVDWLTTTD